MPRRRLRSGRLIVTLALSTGLLVALSLVYFVLHERRGEKAVDASYAAANRVIVALGAYRNEHDEFPASLSELCPRYLTAVPSPHDRFGAWSYEIYRSGKVFNLWFGGRTSAEPVYIYDSTSAEWSVDTK